MLEQIRRTIGKYNFAGQYQQDAGTAGRRHGQGGVVPDLRGQ
jgi:hypothetical protein